MNGGHPRSTIQEEFDELLIYVSGLKKTFNRKLDDHLFIIQQQNQRLDDQSRLIDELAWQIRDLRASVRQVNDKFRERDRINAKNCDCAYANCNLNKFSKNESVDKLTVKPRINSSDRFSSVVIPEEEEEEEDFDVQVEEQDYEPIHFNTGKNAVESLRDYVPKPAQRTTKTTNLTISTQYRNEKRENEMISPTTLYSRIHQNTPEKKTQIFDFNNLMQNYKFKDDLRHDNEEEFIRQNSQLKRSVSGASNKVLCSLSSELDGNYLPEEQQLTEENFIRISRTVVDSDSVPDYRLSQDFVSKRQAFISPNSKIHQS